MEATKTCVTKWRTSSSMDKQKVIYYNNYMIVKCQTKNEPMNVSNLRITTVERPPYATFVRGVNGEITEYKGYIFDIVDLFTKNMNMGYNVTVPEDNEFGRNLGNGSWTGMIGLLLTKVDLAAAFLTLTEERMSTIDFSIAFSHEAFSVLQRHPVKEGNPAALVAPFSVMTWILMLVACGLVAVIIHVFRFTENALLSPQKQFAHLSNFGESVYYVWQTTVNQAVKREPFVSTSSRMLHVSWWLFIAVVTALYSASLTAYMTIPIYDVKVRTMEDVPKFSEVTWLVIKGSSLQTDILTAKNATNRAEVLVSLQEGYENHMGIFVNDEDEAKQLILTKSYVYIREKTILQAMIEKDIRNQTYCRFMLGEDGQIKTREGFGFPKGSPYKPLFDTFLAGLDRHGILVGLKNLYQNPKTACPLTTRGASDARSLSLGDFTVIYTLLLGGLTIAVCVLLLERARMRGCCRRGNPPVAPTKIAKF